MSLGPVQVLVIGTAEEPDGTVMAELDRLADAGIVHLVDLVVVQRSEAGALDTMPAPPGLHSGAGRIAEAFLAGPQGFADAQPIAGDGVGPGPQDDPQQAAAAVAASGTTPDEPLDPPATWSVLEAIPVGGTAVIALIEHVWAGPLRTALREAGAAALGESWLGPADLADLEQIVE